MLDIVQSRAKGHTEAANVVLSGATRLFPVIGDPIAQVRSPEVLTSLLAGRSRNGVVVPVHVASEDVERAMNAFTTFQNLDGVLVTIPHKSAALALCADATDRAKFVGSANVVRRCEHGWFGDNTDGLGYLDGMARHGFFVEGKSALLVGCGGAGSAIGYEILHRGASTLALHDVDPARRDNLIERLAQRFSGKVVIGSADPSGFDLVANATPMGMRPGDPSPVMVERLEARQFVACVVTLPAVPPLIAAARQRGCTTMTGSEMFDAQAEILVDFLLASSTTGAGGN